MRQTPYDEGEEAIGISGLADGAARLRHATDREPTGRSDGVPSHRLISDLDASSRSPSAGPAPPCTRPASRASACPGTPSPAPDPGSPAARAGTMSAGN